MQKEMRTTFSTKHRIGIALRNRMYPSNVPLSLNLFTHALLRKGILVAIGGVVSSQNVDRRVKCRKGRLSGNIGKAPIIRHKVNHFLFHVLSVILHPVSALTETGGSDHMIPNLCSILFIVERQSPIRGEFVRSELLRHDNFG